MLTRAVLLSRGRRPKPKLPLSCWLENYLKFYLSSTRFLSFVVLWLKWYWRGLNGVMLGWYIQDERWLCVSLRHTSLFKQHCSTEPCASFLFVVPEVMEVLVLMFSFNMQIKRTLNELEMLICVQKATLLKNCFIFSLCYRLLCLETFFAIWKS